jgi:gas vesicle protein GvpA/GvpJ/GvpM family
VKRDQVTELLEDSDASLLDLVDNVLTKGVVIDGEIVLGLAGVDLVYLRLSAVLCAADRVLGRRDERGSGQHTSGHHTPSGSIFREPPPGGAPR